MLVRPQFDPIAFSVGPLRVHWYGLMYLLGFLLFLWLGRVRARRFPERGFTAEGLDDLLFYGVLGVILGGRLGQVLFYQPGYYFSHPFQIIAVWNGGMSFHGGLLGVLVAVAYYARKRGQHFLAITDFIAPLVPLGLGAGRIGNFINGELWGRVASPSFPFAMIYPRVDMKPRYPSEIFEFLAEGVLLFILMWWFSAKPRARGAISGMFLLGYGVARFVCEYFRVPDTGIFGHSYIVSMGQWLSLPMIVAGVIMLVWSRGKPAS